jgi:hypothetical protein
MSTINVDIIQSASASNVTIDTDLVVNGDNNIRPYRVYSAILSQSGTNAPTAVVLENTIGDIFLSREGIGDYHISSNSLFTVDKTSISCNGIGDTNGGIVFAVVGGVGFCQLITRTNAGITSDDILFKSFIEIRVYN